MSKNTGGPSFPRDHGHNGITLRDFIAIHATEEDVQAHRVTQVNSGVSFVSITREEAKYAYADAMLEAREK